MTFHLSVFCACKFRRAIAFLCAAFAFGGIPSSGAETLDDYSPLSARAPGKAHGKRRRLACPQRLRSGAGLAKRKTNPGEDHLPHWQPRHTSLWIRDAGREIARKTNFQLGRKMKSPLRLMAGLWFFQVTVSLAAAAEWQWSVEVASLTLPGATAHPRAFLWIPPDCRRVRAVVFAQNNMIEEGILEHPKFRKAMAELGLAELFVAPTFDYWQNATNNDATNEKFSALLKTLAAESGYAELECTPVIPLGHSASASRPWNFGAWNPGRTLAILSLKGDAPQTTLVGNGRPNVDWAERNIDGIPGLMVMGEYEWLEERLAPAFQFVAAHPATPIAMLPLPGRGPFDFDDDALLNYLTRFISKAVVARLPKASGFNEPMTLKPLDPQDGLLVDRWRRDDEPHAKAAKFAKYSGEKSAAFWAFDRAMARLTEKFNARQHRTLPQLLGFVQDGKTLPQSATHNQVSLTFQPDADGLTFQLATTFLETVDGGSPNTTRWTGRPPGSPLGHANGGGPIRLARIAGPVAQLAAATFTVRLNRSTLPGDPRAGDIWLLAEHPGDARFKSAVQQALLNIPARLTEGVTQRITFPQIPAVQHGAKMVKLQAASDSGEKVYYFVREGPAEIDGDTLRFTQLPPRATFPVKVTVVAWQYGRSREPKLQSAEPVERNFLITK